MRKTNQNVLPSLPQQPKRGFSIRIFLASGSPDGLKIVEKSNWTGCGIVCPRPLFPDVKCRPEFNRTGVYVLLGAEDESGVPQCYIGEGDPIRPRIEQHVVKKDYWTTMICFTSKDANLNKAHVQYLEARLLELARAAKRCQLENANSPQLPNVSEADAAEIEGFLDEMLLCLPVLGVSIFERPEKRPPRTTMLFLSGKGIQASGYESSQGFVVLAGSEAVIAQVPSTKRIATDIRATLLQLGLFRVNDGKYQLTQDYSFNSPSVAAAVLLGRSVNGRNEWKTEQGLTLKELQEAATNLEVSKP